MSDSLGICACFTGRITRLIDCLNVLDPLVKIDLLSENENINNICLLVYEGLKEQEQKQQQQQQYALSVLTAENYRQQVEEELEQRGITVNEKIRKEYIDPIVQDYF